MVKYLLSFALITLFCQSGWSQTSQLNGQVVDKNSGEPLPFTNIFINNTTIGTAADANGNFALKNIPYGDNDVVFSYIGYQSYHHHLTIDQPGPFQMTISLTPDAQELSGVEIKGVKDKEWEKQLDKFEKIFLGKTKTSTSCKITNSWVLDFSEDKASKLLLARASQPLEIDNLSLGFKITFYLKDFRAGPQDYSILGYIRFEEIPTQDPNQAVKWTLNRKEVYIKSDRKLFKSIVEGNTKDNGFLLYTDKPGYENVRTRSAVFYSELDKTISKYPTDNIVTAGPRPGEYAINMEGRIEIHYLNEFAQKKTYKDIPYPVSWLEVNGGKVMVDQNGIVLNSVDVYFSGAMSTQRVSDMLPLNYSVDNAIAIEPTEVLVDELNYKRLQEKVYITTDKPYYYPGENIWFKGSMNYSLPGMRDSLSTILYVELINPQRKIIQSHLLKIDSGFTKGDFVLSDTLTQGGYFIRAYTNWMRNYGEGQYFVKSIPVLQGSDRVADTVEAENKLSSGLLLSVNKNVYATREKIELSLMVKDKEGNPIAANLAVAITDANQVIPVKEERNIVTDFPMPKKLGRQGLVELKYPVEYGISFLGQFTNEKKEPEKTTLTIVQGKFDDMASIETTHDGKFWLNGFQFSDTLTFAFQARNSKGKPYGKVVIQNREIPPLDFIKKDFLLNVKHTDYPQRVDSYYEIPKDARLLQNVTIKGQKLSDATRNGVVYGEPDYVLSGEKLLSATVGSNLAVGLQGKIPGLQIQWGYDDLALPHYKIKIRGGSSSIGAFGTTEPLVLVDGIPLPIDPSGANTMGDQLAILDPSTVERIEVITRASPMFGVRGTNGVIAIYTKMGGYKAKENNQSLKSFNFIKMQGYALPRTFEHPDYSDPKFFTSVQADFRSTLYWNPEVKVNNKTGKVNIEFYATDQNSPYRIVVEGVTEEGEPVRGEYFFNVNK